MLRSLALAVLTTAVASVASAQTVTAKIPTAQPTASLAANPFTNKIYVAAPSYGGPSDTILVIDGRTDKVTKQITVPRGAADFPVVDILRNVIYTVGCDTYAPTFSCVVTVINGRTDTVIATKTIITHPGDGVLGVAFDPFYRKLYVANGSDYRVDVVDGGTYKVVGSIGTSDREPFGIAFNPFNQRLYIPFFTDQIEVFDVHRQTRLADVTVGSQDANAAVDFLTGKVFVSDDILGAADVPVLDQDGKVLAQVPVQDNPYGIDVDPITNKVFVANTGTASLTTIDGNANTVINTLSGIDANYVAVNFFSQKVYLSGTSGVTVLTEK